MKKRRISHFIPVANGLQKFLQEHGFEENLVLFKLYQDWKDTVGTTAALHSCPDHLKMGCLYIAVDNPVWTSELGFRKKEILSRIADKIPDLEDIRFVIKRFRFYPHKEGKGV